MNLFVFILNVEDCKGNQSIKYIAAHEHYLYGVFKETCDMNILHKII